MTVCHQLVRMGRTAVHQPALTVSMDVVHHQPVLTMALMLMCQQRMLMASMRVRLQHVLMTAKVGGTVPTQPQRQQRSCAFGVANRPL